MLILTADEDVMDNASYMFILCTTHVYSIKNHKVDVYSVHSTFVL